jgi:FeS assembly SUF system regulator
MLRMSRLTDYGIVLMSEFAADPAGTVRTSRDLAAATGLPPTTVSKLLKQLLRGGLLASQRGLHGGYVLARQPAAITLAEVVAALEGPIVLGDCQAREPGLCLLEGACPVRGTWRAISRTMVDALAGVTLAAVARPAHRLRAHRAAARTGRRTAASGEAKSS